jgi:hypothetical protein
MGNSQSYRSADENKIFLAKEFGIKDKYTEQEQNDIVRKLFGTITVPESGEPLDFKMSETNPGPQAGGAEVSDRRYRRYDIRQDGGMPDNMMLSPTSVDAGMEDLSDLSEFKRIKEFIMQEEGMSGGAKKSKTQKKKKEIDELVISPSSTSSIPAFFDEIPEGRKFGDSSDSASIGSILDESDKEDGDILDDDFASYERSIMDAADEDGVPDYTLSSTSSFPVEHYDITSDGDEGASPPPSEGLVELYSSESGSALKFDYPHTRHPLE